MCSTGCSHVPELWPAQGPPMYQPKDRLLHGHFTSNEILSIPFLKK